MNPPAPLGRRFRVEWVEGRGPALCFAVEGAASPEEAGQEALLDTYGADRPAGAPDRVEVDGVAYEVDEWTEARVFLVPADAAPKARQLAALARAIDAAEALAAALTRLAATGHERKALFELLAGGASSDAADLRQIRAILGAE